MKSSSAATARCWCDAPTRLELGNHEVHVWRAMLGATEPVLEACRSILTPDERLQAERFHFASDRHRAITTRAVLRMILSRYLDLQPAALRFSYNRFGKPALAGERAPAAPRFNLSHSGDLALVALTRRQEIGVDVEQIREDIATEEVAEQFFSPGEAAMLRGLPCHMRTRAFFDCWARKESYIKARGKGLSLPLESFDVSLSSEEPAVSIPVTGGKPGESRWWLRDLPVGGRYAAAVAVPGDDWQLKCWEWSYWPSASSRAHSHFTTL